MIEVSWHNEEQTVICNKIYKGWTIQDLFDALTEMDELIDLVDYDVYGIFDSLETSQVPSGITSNFGSLVRKGNPRLKMVVLVTNSLLVESFNKVYNMIYNDTRIQIAKSYEEAYQLINEDRVAQH